MDNYKKITIDSYEDTLESYDKNMDQIEDYDEPIKFLSYLDKNSLILDLGCGNGKDAKTFVKNGVNVIGVDLSEKMIELATKKVRNAVFRVMDMMKLDFENEYFDGIWARASLIHLSKKDVLVAIKEAYRVLKKNGIFCVAVKEGKSEGFISDTRYNDVKKYYSFFSKEEIEKILTDEGFVIIESYVNEHDKEHDTNPWINIFCRK